MQIQINFWKPNGTNKEAQTITKSASWTKVEEKRITSRLYKSLNFSVKTLPFKTPFIQGPPIIRIFCTFCFNVDGTILFSLMKRNIAFHSSLEKTLLQIFVTTHVYTTQW